MADTTSDAGQKTASAGSASASKGTDSKSSESGEVRDGRLIPDKTESDGPVGFDANPHGNYDLMSVEELRAEAKRLGVWINRDVEKAHLITELRAGVTGTR